MEDLSTRYSLASGVVPIYDTSDGEKRKMRSLISVTWIATINHSWGTLVASQISVLHYRHQCSAYALSVPHRRYKKQEIPFHPGSISTPEPPVFTAGEILTSMMQYRPFSGGISTNPDYMAVHYHRWCSSSVPGFWEPPIASSFYIPLIGHLNMMFVPWKYVNRAMWCS